MTVAKSLQHDAAFEHVSGSARYVDDIPTPSNTLHVAFGLSPIARGEIKSLDLKAVWAAKGCLLYTSPSPRDGLLSRMPSSA